MSKIIRISGKSYDADMYKYKVMDNGKKMIVSRPSTDGSFKWFSVKEYDTPEKYNEQFGKKYKKKYIFPDSKITKLKNELFKKGILFFHIGWKGIQNITDVAWNTAIDMAEKQQLVKQIKKTTGKKVISDIVSILFFTDYMRYDSEITGKLNIQHIILKKDKQNVIDIFTSIFGKDYSWNQKKTQTIDIKLHKK